MQATRDQNFRPAALGVSDSDASVVLPWEIDSVTGRLLVDIEIVADDSPTAPSAPAPREQNFLPSGMGVSDLDNQTPIPLTIDHRNSKLYADVISE